VSSENVAQTFADHVRARSADDNVAIRFDNESLTYREWCSGVASRSAMWLDFILACIEVNAFLQMPSKFPSHLVKMSP